MQIPRDICRARISRQAAFAVCLDILSAYDYVWIDGLIHKLAHLGVRCKISRLDREFFDRPHHQHPVEVLVGEAYTG